MRKYLFPIIILIIANVALFYKFYLHGLLPFPGDLLVSYYFPWNGGGFAGFDPWTTRKDVIAMDVIRQIYPWKTLAFDIIKSGQIPFWNPYNFSGTPLLANLQSSVFFPGSIFFLILPYLPAWLINVTVLPLLFSIFCYIFLRSFNLSKVAALFGAIVLSNLSYIVVWAEQLVVIQSVLFLPLILWLVNKKKFIWAAPLLAFSVFGGHIQTSVYVYLIVVAYAVFKRVTLKELLGTIFLSIVLSSVQLVPTLELYLQSAREGIASQALFYSSTFPWQNLTTFLAPDFFGNPATNNFRGIDYGNFQGYFGITAFVLSFFSLFEFRKNKTIMFFAILGLLGLISSLYPFAYIFDILNIPILSSGYPARIIFIFQFSFAVLAAFGLDFVLKEKLSWRKFLLPLSILMLAYGILFIFTLQNSTEWLITRKNLILPLGIFLAVSIALVSSKLLTRKSLIIIIALAILEYSYFFNKYQPFAKSEFVFPNHPVFSFLKKSAGESRFYGKDRAYVDNNFATQYRVFSPEGYDPLYIRRYGELLAAGEKVARSDAVITQNNIFKQNRILDILGVKFEIDKTDSPATDFGPNLEKFPKTNYRFIKQYDKWKFYERKTALPRVKLFGEYTVMDNDTVNALYNSSFDPKKTLILEKRPTLKITPGTGSATLSSNKPNKIIINTNSQTNQLLFLSDSFYPGWVALVDNKEAEILRANYAFRVVAVPKGKHQIAMTYNPISFKIGSVLTIIGLFFWLICLKKLKK